MIRNWRVGTKVPLNVYDGDRPVCQCHTASDARMIVLAVNKWIEWANRINAERAEDAVKALPVESLLTK